MYLLPAEREAWLKEIFAAGVKNIEMESSAFSAFATKGGIRCGAMATAIVDRFQGDQVRLNAVELAAYSTHAIQLAVRMVQRWERIRNGELQY